MIRKVFHQEAPLLPYSLRVKNALVFHLKNILPHSPRIESLRLAVENQIREQFKLGAIPLPQVETITPPEFKKHYLKKGIPLLIKAGARNWDCTRKWGLDYLIKEIGEQKISALAPEDLTYNQQEDSPIREVQLAEFLKKFPQSSENLRFSNMIDFMPSLRKDINTCWVKEYSGHQRIGIQSFISHQGVVTPLHAESSSFFYIMLKGRKKWKLYPPLHLLNLETAPFQKPYLTRQAGAAELDQLFHYEGVMEEGDILFVPTWMWHKVENLSDCLAINARFISFYDLIKTPEILAGRIIYSRPFIVLKLWEAVTAIKNNSATLTPKFKK